MDGKRFLFPNLNKPFIRFLLIIIISLIFILLIQPPPFLFLDLSFHFSTFPFFSQTLERKFIFLVCNGILAILAQSLSLSTTNSPNYMAEAAAIIPLAELNVIDHATDLATVTALILDHERQNRKINEEKKSNCDICNNSNDKGQARETNPVSITDFDAEDEDQDQDGEENGDLMMLGSSADVANDDVKVNTEEFNKKIEEFIRKMKEELKIEAQQQRRQQQQQLTAV